MVVSLSFIITWCKFRRQHGIGPYIVDFYCPAHKMAIEVDGDTHYSVEEKQKDELRTQFLNKNSISVLRFTNLDIFESIDGVIGKIKNHLN
ncbi:MAG: endonuclease domain-containing protein [Patescibacteria group bacterium]